MTPPNPVAPAEAGNPFDDFRKYLEPLGVEAPEWLLKALLAVLALGVVVTAVKTVTPVLHESWNVVRWLVGGRLADERRRRRRRQLFAQHLDDRLRHLELQEDWRDEKYAELEAEVEIEHSRRWQWARKLLPVRGSTLRRVRSLSHALGKSDERLVLLEGEPGAGKSVALRHLARLLTRRASTSRDIKATIPLYLNLKQLDVRPEDITAEAVREFVLATLDEANSRDVQEVLDTEFDRGLEEGTWLFLFDSFDEIPDILSAEDARRVAPRYAQAIADFLGPFGRCRGIVASRDFSSPDIRQFTRFRILRLSPRQQQRLITRADLDRRVDRAMRAGLATASRDVSTFAGNPMFLGLLCEHMRNNATFPTASHTVFEDYLSHRLRRDAARIEARFGITADFVRAGAEEASFLMASVPRMGLTPTREALIRAAPAQERVSPRLLGTVLQALEYTKLGRTDVNATGDTTFSFVHRRFQEYFATCVVIGAPGRVTVDALLDDDRWRETAVTLLQVQDGQAVAALTDEATARLRRYADEVDGAGPFRWPAGCLHLLGILATGLETHPAAVTDEIRGLVDRVLERAWTEGHRLHKRRTLAFANLATATVTERLLTEAFRSRNEYLREAAFRTAGALPALNPVLRARIRRALLGLAAGLDVHRKRASTVAQVKRLSRPTEFLNLLNLLSIAMPIALAFSAGGFLVPVVDFVAHYESLGVAERLMGAVFGSFMLVTVVTVVISAAFRTASATGGGGTLDKALSRAALPEYRLLAATSTTVLLGTNAVFSLLVTTQVAALLGWYSIAGWLALGLFGALWPAAVIWASRTGIGTSPAWWPLLPLLLVVVGGYRVPRWSRARLGQVRDWPAARHRVARLLRTRLPRLGKALVSVGVAGTVATGAVTLVLGVPVLVPVVIWLSGLALVVLLTALVASSGVFLLRPAGRARTADQALDLLARARSTTAVGFVVERFGARGIARDPDVRFALENLVGEIEQAQRRADDDPGLLLRDACPSLAARRTPRHPLLDAWPLRATTRLQVRSLSEEVLDDLARLVEQE
ncbi:NACHT domain-containing protein [Actinosynnema sp. NPDC059335]|uniref:NACHT domain-containing protein n=1 Tax=Actinosynnema sp. NPDC059335 TaxID=3346804 RepID=UPI00366E3FA2